MSGLPNQFTLAPWQERWWRFMLDCPPFHEVRIVRGPRGQSIAVYAPVRNLAGMTFPG